VLEWRGGKVGRTLWFTKSKQTIKSLRPKTNVGIAICNIVINCLNFIKLSQPHAGRQRSRYLSKLAGSSPAGVCDFEIHNLLFSDNFLYIITHFFKNTRCIFM
jgi:hypothetical protein